MAKEIRQRISLEGGDKIRAEFQSLAKAGQESFNKIREAAQDRGLLSGAVNAFSAFKTRAAEIGTAAAEVGRSFGNLEKSVLNFTRNTSFLVAGVGAATFGMVAFLKSTSDVADAIAKTAAALGLSTSAYQELSFAASQAGVDQQQFDTAQGRLARSADAIVKKELEVAKQIKDLQRQFALGKVDLTSYNERLRDLRESLSENINPFRRMGVELARNRDGSVNLEETQNRLADAFQASRDGALKASVAFEVFGRGGLRMVGFLNQGRAGLDAMRKEAIRLGLVISGDVLKRQEELNDAFDKLGRAATSTRVNIAAVFSPTAVKFIDAFVEAMAKWRLEAVVLATQLANKLVPIVDDFIALLEGREGDVQNTVVIQIRDAIVDAGRAVKQAVTEIIVPAFQALVVAAGVVAQALNGIFGTDLSGGALLVAAAFAKVTGTFGVFKAIVTTVVSIVRLLAVTFGGLPVVLGLIAVAIALFIVNNTNALQKVRDAWNATIAFISNAWTATQTLVSDGVSAIAGFFTDTIPTAAAAVWAGIVNQTGLFWESIKALFNAGVEFITAIFTQTIPAALSAVWQLLVAGASAAWEGIKTSAGEFATAIVDTIKTAVDSIASFFRGLLDFVTGIFKRILEGASKTAAAVRSVQSSAPQAAGGGLVQAFAGGGAVRGPGSGTSDSIRAWLSNGEFVIRSAAVKKYGAALFAALNGMRIPAPMFKFSGGGLVESMASLVPRVNFADGGLVSTASAAGGGGRPFTLQIGDQSFAGLNATDDAALALQRFAINRSVRSAGRRPTWFRG